MTRRDAAVEVWLRKAESDLLCISNNLAAESVPWDTVVFHAQQAAEKVLKALLVCAAQPVPRTHDLVALATLLSRHGYDMAPVEAEVSVLSRFGVGVRYPDLLYEPTEDDGRDLAAAALRLRAFALAILGSSSGDETGEGPAQAGEGAERGPTVGGSGE